MNQSGSNCAFGRILFTSRILYGRKALLCLFTALLLLSDTAVAETSAAQQAKDILTTAKPRRGLCVLIGGDNGKLLGELAGEFARTNKFLVHALAVDKKNVPLARQTLLDMKLYGVASVDILVPPKLPYADNMINLIVIRDRKKILNAGCAKEEIMRVLAPRGVAMFGDGESWERVEKPLIPGTDEWTHPGHGPDGNPVSSDEHIGPPTSLRWLYGPAWLHPGGGRSATAGGRVFYLQGGKIKARDAYNGLWLWCKPSKAKEFIASGDYVYVQGDSGGGKSQGLEVRDALTGDTVKTHAGISGSIVLSGDCFIALSKNGLRSVNMATGEEKWHNPEVPDGCNLLVSGNRIFLKKRWRPGDKLVSPPMYCHDLLTGERLWTTSHPPFLCRHCRRAPVQGGCHPEWQQAPRPPQTRNSRAAWRNRRTLLGTRRPFHCPGAAREAPHSRYVSPATVEVYP